jgi:hypothetical protein
VSKNKAGEWFVDGDDSEVGEFVLIEESGAYRKEGWGRVEGVGKRTKDRQSPFFLTRREPVVEIARESPHAPADRRRSRSRVVASSPRRWTS